jgi:hypothetical protein
VGPPRRGGVQAGHGAKFGNAVTKITGDLD